MSRKDKSVQRLLSIPTDMTWEELVRALAVFDFVEYNKGKTAGSRRKFVNPENSVILLHKPHPSNVVKKYAIRQVIETLKSKGFL
jgi:hypothetical protein